LVKPGYYAHVLKKIANVEHVQVNGLDHPVFVETEQPALLCQDLSTVKLATELDVPALEKVTGLTVRNLTDWHGVIDWCFAKFGPRAIAVKNQSAYTRRLNYAQVGADEVTAAFKRYLAKPTDVRPDELKAIEDHLFHLTVTRATEHRLPVKLHTGQYMGNDWMPLRRVRDNISDLCPVVQAHPEAEFVIMHMGYPYQDELISFAKHHTNVWVDLCWAWIINPAAAVRFVKEFLMAVPSNRLLTFGGDHFHVELVTGHARLARRGLALALSELVGDRWIARQDVEPLVERLMRGNANALFDYEGTLANWGPQA